MASSAVAGPPKTIAELRRQRDELADLVRARTAERDEALAQHRATSEILGVIARSPTDVRPVFEAIVGNAAKLCEAEFSAVTRFDDGLLHLVAINNMSPDERAAFHSLFPRRPTRAFAMGRAFLEARPVQFDDVLTERDYDAGTREVLQSVAGYRTFLGVPILLDGRPIGVIGCGRREVKPFAAAQIELVETFADQAAIALDNVRLFNELESRNRDVGEALEQQTATAEVLQVINSSLGDLAPVFDAIVEKAHTLCDAACGSLQLWDGEKFRGVAMRGFSEAMAEGLRQGYVPGPSHPCRRLLEGERIAHCADLAEIDDPVTREGGVALGAIRTILFVALRRDDSLLGQIVAARQEVRPFSEKEIALVENFAAQAVIAIENARLIGETREALEQQTATAEVLQVINASPGDLAPVFDAMLEKALHLCGAPYGILWNYDGEFFEIAAQRGVPKAFLDTMSGSQRPTSPETTRGRLVAGEHVVHITNLGADLLYHSGDPHRRALIDAAGARVVIAVSLRKDDELLGAFTIYRQEARPFTDKQIALVTTFAAQAVIAIENARLLTETREALEQQTATAEVLGVINSSPGDLAPVFDAILDKAHSLCDIAQGSLELYDGERFRAVAVRGLSDEFAEILRQGSPASDNPATRPLIEGERFSYIADMAASDFPVERTAAATEGVRTLLCVPLRREGQLLGMIASARKEMRPFSEKEIALLENFAAQAVIAMENARLLTETREALEQQTATAEVLQVINSSPGDLAPVFDAMLEKATRLCGAPFGQLAIYDGEMFRFVAAHGEEQFALNLQREPHPPSDGVTWFRILGGDNVVHVPDVRETDLYRSGHLRTREFVDHGRGRSLLSVALRKDDSLLGVLSIYRQEVRPFSDKQIALLQNFAAQAVVAMENARLITETREALEQQTATAEVLQVINSSPGDLSPVFEAMLDKAMRLCDAAFGALMSYDGEKVRAVSTRGFPPELVDLYADPIAPRRDGDSPYARFLRGEALLHIPDMAAEEVRPSLASRPRALVEIGGARTGLELPLRKDDALLGSMWFYRQEVRPFSDKQIALLQSFAAQAVIAMENARLLTETREALEQQTATAEVLQVINASPGDLAPVFEAILEKAHGLCRIALGALELHENGKFRTVAVRGVSGPVAELLRQPFEPPPDSPLARLLSGEQTVQIADVSELARLRPDDSRAQIGAQHGLHTALFVPLRKDTDLLGQMVAFRREVRPFSDKETALLQSFAAQAVIAIENARLITETREALEQQTATAEVLQVINRSPGDLAPVFEAMLEKALRLCGGSFGELRTYDGERFRLAATQGVPTAYIQHYARGDSGIYGPGTGPARILAGEHVVHITDLVATEPYQRGDPDRIALVDLGGARSYLLVPLLKDEAVLGYIMIYRREVGSFSEKQIALLQNFAAQAVIAIENARLLDEIRQRQAELRVTFDNMADGVVMFDEELRLAAWNRNFQEIIDLSDAFFAEPRTYRDYIRLLAERGEFGAVDPEDEIRRYTESAARHTTVERTRPDGRVLEVRHNPVPSGGFVLIYTDVTERKRSEAEIRAARDAAEEASRTIAAAYQELKTAQARLIQAEKMASLGQLTAGIAHEIKNPLNFVNNFAGLSVELLDELKETARPMLAGLAEDERADVDEIVGMLTGNLEKIAEHGRRADGIVKSMLEHSRGGGGERREVDLNALIEEALNLAYHGARAQDQNFNIALERDFDLGIAPIELAPQEMTRVLLNLFGNGFYAASKRQRENAEPDFRPTLKVATRDLGEAVEIRIRDNGAGIPSEIRDKLFQPFFTTKPTGEGTGLGLSISWDIVTQQHGGTIAVDSRVGEFTEFAIRLPRTPRTATTATTTTEAAA